MRVITGSARGRRLKAPPGDSVRPTSAMVKEAVFSAIQFEIEGARVLDLFAGSGQMGIEALSRGAASCVFVDHAKESLAALKENLSATGPWSNAKVAASDALSYVRGCAAGLFDVAFLDPPYAAGLLGKLLPELAGLMSAGGVIFCEAPTGAPLPETCGEYALKKRYRYGKTTVAQYRRRGPLEDPE